MNRVLEHRKSWDVFILHMFKLEMTVSVVLFLSLKINQWVSLSVRRLISTPVLESTCTFLGLDLLKRHQCQIDLLNNKLIIGTTKSSTPFLSESELPKHARLTQEYFIRTHALIPIL